MLIYIGDENRVVYFIAVDTTDLYTRETSLTSLAVWYSIDGGAQTLMDTPTATHIANGVYKLKIDEAGMVALSAGVNAGELILHITADEMVPVTRVITIKRPLLSTLGATAGGTWTVGKILKVLTAWASGKWQDKVGSPGVYEVLDPDDGATVIAEVTPQTTTPQKSVTIL